MPEESIEAFIRRCTPVAILGFATAMRRRHALERTLRDIRLQPTRYDHQRRPARPSL